MTTEEQGADAVEHHALWPWLERTLGRPTYMTLLFVLWVWAWAAYLILHSKGVV